MNEYNITLKIRNNLLLQAFKNKGEVPGEVLAQKIGISYPFLNMYVTLKRSPLDNDGNYRDEVFKICEFLNMPPSSLWTEEQLTPLSKSTVEVTASYDQLATYLPYSDGGFSSLDNEDTKRLIDEMVDKLTEREKWVIQRKFGIDGEVTAISELAKELQVTPSYIRQIEYKALRKLRHPSLCGDIKAMLGHEPPKPYEFL